MEPGPASFFSAAQLTIKPEPALGADSDRVDVGDTTKLEQDFARLESTLTDAEALLSSVAEDLQVHINAVDNTIKAELAGTAPMIPEAITAEFDTVQGAIDGAESSFVQEAFTDTPPWYQPPVEEEPAPPEENNPRGPQPA